MPELPEVERWRRCIDAVALHRRIEDADLKGPTLLDGVAEDEVQERLESASFERTARHGKYVFAALEQGDWLLLDPGTTGRLVSVKDHVPPPEHTRLLIRFADGSGVAFVSMEKRGRIGLVESPEAFVQREQLGPDALTQDMPLGEFRERLQARNGPIKAALMDQHFIAGVGNLYSDEIQFEARIHPCAEVRNLTKAQIASVHAAITRVLHIALGWSPESDHLPSSWLLPHRVGGGACPHCNRTLEEVALGGQTAVFCPHCQRMPKRRARQVSEARQKGPSR